jgi:aspartate ammonia-lyase
MNAIIITALNPIIGYEAGAHLVKESLAMKSDIQSIALAYARLGKLNHIFTGKTVTPEEIDKVFSNLKLLTQGGLY